MNTLYLVRPHGPGKNHPVFKWRVICEASPLDAVRTCVLLRKRISDAEHKPTYEVVPAMQESGYLASYVIGTDDTDDTYVTYVPDANSSFDSLWDWTKLQLINM